MSVLPTIRELYAHMEWADAAVWRAILATPAAADDKKLVELIHHVHLVQRGFLSLWQEAKLDFPGVETFAGLTAIMEWGRTYHPLAANFLDRVSESDLDRPVEQPWAARVAKQLGRPPETPSLRQTFFQVAMHSLYHRGQVNIRLRELGVDPPLVDFIAWIWEGQPAAVWPAVPASPSATT
jgi:uncharacterized damage-inducible protein DinB